MAGGVGAVSASHQEAGAEVRVLQRNDTPDQSADQEGAAPFVPQTRSLRTLAEAVQQCKGCPLYRNATQGVFGEGAKVSRWMLIGEQPGDAEDRMGRPFVGPAGRILDRALAEAGMTRDEVYVTNAVKHFKWTPRGKRRLHQKPNAREASACRPWLDREIELVRPRGLLALGATAAQSLFGRMFRLTQHRGETVASALAPVCMATVHPSSILRVPKDADRQAAYEAFVRDLAAFREAAGSR